MAPPASSYRSVGTGGPLPAVMAWLNGSLRMNGSPWLNEAAARAIGAVSVLV